MKVAVGVRALSLGGSYGTPKALSTMAYFCRFISGVLADSEENLAHCYDEAFRVTSILSSEIRPIDDAG